MNICAKFDVAIFTKTVFFHFERQRWILLTQCQGHQPFFYFPPLCDLNGRKSVGGFIFTLLMRCQLPWCQSSSLIFLASWSSMTLTRHVVAKSLDYVEVSPTRSMLIDWLCFDLIQALCQGKPSLAEIVIFIFDLSCQIIGDPARKKSLLLSW